MSDKEYTSRVVMLTDVPITPQVLLAQMREEVDDIESFVSVIFRKGTNGQRTVQSVWTKMKQHDLAYASVVLDVDVRRVVDVSKDGNC